MNRLDTLTRMYPADDPEDYPIDYPERGPDTPTSSTPARTTVTVDTVIERPDLAPGNHTLVAAGDKVPIGLEHYPRHPS